MNSAVAKEQLNQCVNNMCEELAERQSALINTLEETRVQKAESLNSQLSEKQSLLDNAGLVMYTQELLKENDQPCFVQAARVTHNRCECVCVTWCVYESLKICPQKGWNNTAIFLVLLSHNTSMPQHLPFHFYFHYCVCNDDDGCTSIQLLGQTARFKRTIQ